MSTTTVGTDPIALIDVLTVEPEDQQATLVILIEASVQASRSDRACPDDGGRLHADRGARADR